MGPRVNADSRSASIFNTYLRARIDLDATLEGLDQLAVSEVGHASRRRVAASGESFECPCL